MEPLERTVCLLIVVVIISKFSLQECHNGTFKDVCWMRLNDSNFCAHFTDSNFLNCTHLKELNSYNKGDSVIDSIQIHNDSTSDVIGTELFNNFSEIKLINITKTNIKHINAGALSNLSHLKYVFLNNNKIEYLSSEIFNGLKNVEVLNLARNNLTHIKNNSFRELHKLHELDLSSNHITNLSFWSPICEALTFLDLSNNEIEMLQLPNCASLKYLNIAGNKINTLEKNLFKNISLIYFDVSWNKLHRIGDNFLRNFSKLEVLNLGGNPIFDMKDIAVNFFHNSQTLKTLNLTSTSLRRLDNGVFQMLEKLENLDLSSNHLKSLPKLLFYKLSKLRMINLSGNMITNIELHEFSSVIILHLDYNDWTCEVLADIFTKKPYIVSVANGNFYNGPNINGIGCLSETGNNFNYSDPSTSKPDPSFLQKQYLSSLVEGQADMKKAFDELSLYLNDTYFRQKFFSKDYLKSMQNTLTMRDAILYSIFVATLTITALFAVIYFDRRKNSVNKRDRGELLRTISVSS